ncbi:MAG: hypothetical protein J6P30_07730 [Fibrobacter sp.]|nr:hypothetical protein [Fibrobacter sp.]
MDEIVREFGSWKICGNSVWSNIIRARELGYQIEMYYVGVDSVDIAKVRIASRVLKGGHGIPDSDVERRFSESIRNLPKAIELCDIVEIFDNTDSFQRIARYEQGKCVLKVDSCPLWVP